MGLISGLHPAATALPDSPRSEIGNGIWRVGVNIVPGTYRTAGNERCSWKRLSGFSGEFTDTIAFKFPDGVAVVTVNPTDAGFSSDECGTWVLADTSA